MAQALATLEVWVGSVSVVAEGHYVMQHPTKKEIRAIKRIEFKDGEVLDFSDSEEP